MRKIKYIIAGISAVVFMVSCELDNFDGPDAQVYGAVIDAVNTADRPITK